MNEKAATLGETSLVTLGEALAGVDVVLAPPEGLRVSEAAAKYRQVYNPGAYVGPWRNETTPYLVEPMDVLESDDHTAMIFAGPAQCGKSDMFFNWLTYKVACDPADLLFYEKTLVAAQEWAETKAARVLEHTPVLADSLVARARPNRFRRYFRQGMHLLVSWPTKANFRGRSVGSIWLADYDGMPSNVDGEGAPFALARKRATTFMRRAMVVAESSPAFPVDMAAWAPKTLHEAPPAFGGILPLYNQGDRRRWYWRCTVCDGAFEPGFNTVKWPESEDVNESAEAAWIECPHCHARYRDEPGENTPSRLAMNRERACWVPDGVRWRKDGSFDGTPRRSSIASFWLKGPPATFVTLPGLVGDYLRAREIYEATGEEDELRTVTNVTLAEPYVPQAQQVGRTPDSLRNRARPMPEREVPEGVRFLVAAIDVQKRWFVVQVIGIGIGTRGEPDWWVIDRFNIYKSKRKDEDGESKRIDPASHPEDWRQIAEEVLMRTYPLSDGSGRRMRIKLTVCDHGGLKGVAEAGYKFVYWLRRGDDDISPDADGRPVYAWEEGLDRRFYLVRGYATGPRVKLTFPDSGRRDRFAVIRGEIPVWQLNTQTLKDAIDAMLAREEPGGMIHFPEWLPQWFYEELCVEIKDPKKGWINPNNKRNEAWDLLVYAKAATLMPDIDIEHIDWNDPPPFARPWDENEEVFDPTLPTADKADTDAPDDLEELGGLLA